MQPIVDHAKGIYRQGNCDCRQRPADNGRRAIDPANPTEPHRFQSKDSLFRPESSRETHSSRQGGRTRDGATPFRAHRFHEDARNSLRRILRDRSSRLAGNWQPFGTHSEPPQVGPAARRDGGASLGRDALAQRTIGRMTSYRPLLSSRIKSLAQIARPPGTSRH